MFQQKQEGFSVLWKESKSKSTEGRAEPAAACGEGGCLGTADSEVKGGGK